MGRARVGVAWIAALVVAGACAPAAGAAGDPWVTRALELQHELGGDVGMVDAPTLGTHNSFNSPATVGQTLSAQDSNQKIPMVDQLDLGIRSLEIDLHTFPNAQGGGYVPTVCHAQPRGVGCTVEPPMEPVFTPLAAWVKAHPDEVLFLYLENDLGPQSAHDEAARILESLLGPFVFRPAATGPGACTQLPDSLSRDAVRAAGKRVVLVGNCGPGTAWNGLVHDWDSHVENRPFGFDDFPACGPAFKREDYATKLVRYFEDSTQLNRAAAVVGATQVDNGLTPETVAAMLRCGVDLLGLDQVVPGDARLEAAVWSWARDEPTGGRCAIQRVGTEAKLGRWYARGCARRHRAACRAGDGTWKVTRRGTTGGTKARAACRKLKARHAAPRTGYEAQLLRVAMEQARTGAVWLGLRRTATAWRGIDPR